MFLEQEPMYCPVQGNSKSILECEIFLYWILRTTSDTTQRSSFSRLEFGVEYSGFQSRNERKIREGLVSVTKRSWQWRIQGRTPLIFKPNWGPNGGKKFFWRPPLPPPRTPISRFGFGTAWIITRQSWILDSMLRIPDPVRKPWIPDSKRYKRDSTDSLSSIRNSKSQDSVIFHKQKFTRLWNPADYLTRGGGDTLHETEHRPTVTKR